MPVPLIPIVIAGANVVARVAPLVARRLIARGVAKKATQKQITKQVTNAKKPVQRISEKRAEELASAARPKVGVKPSGKNLPRGGASGATTVATGIGTGIYAAKKSKKGKQPLIEAGNVPAPPKITAAKPVDAPASAAPASDSKKTTKAKDPTEGGRYAFYPGQTSKDLGLMYEVDKNKMSDEVRERLEEEELYEGDYKGGRVGKGKKMKMKKGGSPKGCGPARS